MTRWNGLQTAPPRSLVTLEEVARQWPNRQPVAAGIPVGREVGTGRTVHCDPLTLQQQGLLNPPRAVVSGTSTALLQRWILGLSAVGQTPVVAGDQQGHLARTVAALDGEVFRIGRDHHTINPLDDEASSASVVEILLAGAGERRLSDEERSTLVRHLRELRAQWSEPEPPQLWHLAALLANDPDASRLALLLSSIRHHYGDVLDRPTSVALDTGQAVCLEVDPVHERDPFLQAALTVLCWSVTSRIAQGESCLVIADGVTAVARAGLLDLSLPLVQSSACVTLCVESAEDLPEAVLPAGLLVSCDGTLNTFCAPGQEPFVAELHPGPTEQRLALGTASPAPASIEPTQPAESTAADGAPAGDDADTAPLPDIDDRDPRPRVRSGRRTALLVATGAAAAAAVIAAAVVTRQSPPPPVAQPAQAGADLAVSTTADTDPSGVLAAAAPVTPDASALIAAASPVTVILGGLLASSSSVPPAGPEPGGGVVAAAQAPEVEPGGQVVTAAAPSTGPLPLHLDRVAWSAAATWQQERDYVTQYLPIAPAVPAPAAPAPVYQNTAPAPVQPAYPQTAPAQSGAGNGGPPPAVTAPGAPPPNQPFNPQNPDSQP